MWPMVLLLLLVVVAVVAISGQRHKRRIETRRADSLRGVRTLAEEDVTVFGEELQNLHIETMTTELNTAMRQDYQRALNSYET
ncbi:MAG: hypothetical protein ACRCYU_17790, partial [Nocardioides sp.]